MNEREKFLYPKSRYRGEFSPENLVFNSNIQEFAHKVNYICGLETNGKITPEEAYYRIKELWKQLKSSKKNLNIGDKDSEDENNGDSNT
ncbi:hypothetical protein ACL6C3_07500 [Capilliphycus salinus ALCB114379]|uniref:DUF7219 family protein n=1 Tax=Capilliphycus salinus TaxID=2768948 RepID=UPI0039A753A4